MLPKRKCTVMLKFLRRSNRLHSDPAGQDKIKRSWNRCTRGVIDSGSRSQQTRRVTILIVCPEEARMDRLKDAIHSAGFTLIASATLNEAWSKTDYFDFSAVVIDSSLTNDIAAAAFGQRFITLRVREETPAEEVALELANLFRRSSELIQ